MAGKGDAIMTYQEALEQISSQAKFGIKPGLERIIKLLDKMGNPQDRLKFVHVAGTNGKGSTCALLSSVLTAAGYKTGLYISPYILEFRERMQICGQMIPKEELAALTEELLPLIQEMEQDGDALTEFEFITALAMEWFARSKCDVVVLEVGLGGRFDATNIIKTPLVSVIMSISLDHTGILGDTVEKIAFEKAGIIKEGGDTVVFSRQDYGAMQVMREAAQQRNNSFCVAEPEEMEQVESDLLGTRFVYRGALMHMPLIGEHQVLNAATVLAALDVLRRKGFKLPLQAVAEGFAQVSFPARLELLSKNPIFLLDGAHNPNGVQALAAALRQYLSGKRITAIMGMLADKDSHASIGYLNGLLDQVYTLTPDNPRAMQAEDFAALWREMGVSAKAAQSPRQAVELALAHAGSDGAIIVCGSLYLAAEIRPIAIEILKGMAPSA